MTKVNNSAAYDSLLVTDDTDDPTLASNVSVAIAADMTDTREAVLAAIVDVLMEDGVRPERVAELVTRVRARCAGDAAIVTTPSGSQSLRSAFERLLFTSHDALLADLWQRMFARADVPASPPARRRWRFWRRGRATT